MEIKRDVYLEQFKIRKDNGMIKIITGKCVNIGRHRTKGEDEAASTINVYGRIITHRGLRWSLSSQHQYP